MGGGAVVDMMAVVGEAAFFNICFLFLVFLTDSSNSIREGDGDAVCLCSECQASCNSITYM